MQAADTVRVLNECRAAYALAGESKDDRVRRASVTPSMQIVDLLNDRFTPVALAAYGDDERAWAMALVEALCRARAMRDEAIAAAFLE